jgi:uncharacterized protein YceH (UPF0502 family)
VLNLFLAVIVGAMESVRDAEDAEEDAEMRTAIAESEADIVAEIASLRQEVIALRGLLEDRTPASAGASAGSGRGDEPD